MTLMLEQTNKQKIYKKFYKSKKENIKQLMSIRILQKKFFVVVLSKWTKQKKMEFRQDQSLEYINEINNRYSFFYAIIVIDNNLKYVVPLLRMPFRVI